MDKGLDSIAVKMAPEVIAASGQNRKHVEDTVDSSRNFRIFAEVEFFAWNLDFGVADLFKIYAGDMPPLFIVFVEVPQFDIEHGGLYLVET